MSLTTNQEQLLYYLKQVALEIGESGRSLTSLIGELSACTVLNLIWQPREGYDALTTSDERIQIKTRKSWSTQQVNPRGRLGRFGKKGRYEFDEGIFVELDNNFEVSHIYLLPRQKIQELETKESTGRGLHISTFTSQAIII